MAFYQFTKEQIVPTSIAELWQFIAAPQNLKEITPDYMGFDITSQEVPNLMYPGMIISYTVRPILGIKTTWVTEITQVRTGHYFVDEQRVGPYSLWHHQHILEPHDEGVLMRDIVSYQPPLGWLGKVANSLLIRKKLAEIFDYRTHALIKRFGESPVITS